ncbi:MAG: hypothetical protein HN674_08480 [Candidatus Marinimicrobia bacterium]|jgi:hypothetical protein|nr:hypothetical protein [Candidatus Neomarinimicrobiota bacterium]
MQLATMTSSELYLIKKYILGAKNYLEFGSGNSTIIASKTKSIKKIHSVETSSDFIHENLLEINEIKNRVKLGSLVFQITNIGQVRRWGYPKNDNKIELWPNYSLGAFLTNDINYDLVLVDGLFRVACTLSSLLNTPQDCIIMIHDFWNRPRYHVLLEFLDPIESADTLGVFRKKEFNNDRVKSILMKYLFRPSDHPPRYTIRYIWNEIKLIKQLKKYSLPI